MNIAGASLKTIWLQCIGTTKVEHLSNGHRQVPRRLRKNPSHGYVFPRSITLVAPSFTKGQMDALRPFLSAKYTGKDPITVRLHQGRDVVLPASTIDRTRVFSEHTPIAELYAWVLGLSQAGNPSTPPHIASLKDVAKHYPPVKLLAPGSPPHILPPMDACIAEHITFNDVKLAGDIVLRVER